MEKYLDIILTNILTENGNEITVKNIGNLAFTKILSTAKNEKEVEKTKLCYNNFEKRDNPLKVVMINRMMKKMLKQKNEENGKAIKNRFNDYLKQENSFFQLLIDNISKTKMKDDIKNILYEALNCYGTVSHFNPDQYKQIYKDNLEFFLKDLSYENLYIK